MNIEDLISKFQKLKPQKDLVLGIDHGTHAFRYVLVNQKGNILKYGEIYFSSSPKEQEKAQEQILKDLAKEIDLSKLQAINLNLQGPAITIGRFKIPVTEKKDEEDAIRHAIRNQVDIPSERIIYYSREYKGITKEGGQESDAKQSTFNFVAADKNSLAAIAEPYEDLFKMTPTFTIAGYGYENYVACLDEPYARETFAILNIGRSVTCISVFQDGKLLFQRDIPLAGQDITRSIMIMYRPEENAEEVLELERAEEIKRNFKISIGEGHLPEQADTKDKENDRIFQSIKGVLSAWVQDVRLSFHYFYENYESQKISKVLVAGGSADLGNIIPYLQKQLNIPTEKLSFPKNMPGQILTDEQTFKNRFHEYLGAFSFALKPSGYADLIIKKIKKIDYAELLAPFFRIGFVFVTAIIATWFAFLLLQGTQLKDVENAVQSHQQFLKQIEAPYLDLVKWRNFLSKADSKQYPASRLMMAVSKYFPKNAIIQKLLIDREQNEVMVDGAIFGDAKKRAVSVTEFTKQLLETPYFSDVEVTRMNPVSNKPDEGTFRLTIEVRKR